MRRHPDRIRRWARCLAAVTRTKARMTTLQQLAGAAGTALLIMAMSIGAASAVTGRNSAAHDAFIADGCLAVVAVLFAPFIRRAPPE